MWINKAFIFFILGSICLKAQIQDIDANSNSSFRSVYAISDKKFLASGSNNTLIIGKRYGKKIKNLKLSVKDTLDFRGVLSPNKKDILLMSSGENKARIYTVNKKGENLKLLFEENATGAFFDSFHFANANLGYLIGDPIDHKPYLLKTENGGKDWQRIKPENLPDLIKGEASFAASNSCLFSNSEGLISFITQKRIFISQDFGENWIVTNSPIEANESSGNFGIYFLNKNQGFVVGGDYLKDKNKYLNMAITQDGGVSWTAINVEKPQGLKEGMALLNNELIITGPTGITILENIETNHFKQISDQGYHAISCSKKVCYLSGAKGKIASYKPKKKTASK